MFECQGCSSSLNLRASLPAFVPQWKGWVRAQLSLGLPLAPGLIGEPVGPVVHCSYQGLNAELTGRLWEGLQ